MYDQFYRFNAEPFRLSPDHAFAYTHKGFEKARAYMAYAFMRAEGFVMITGRPGTGKTTLVGALVEQLAEEDVNVANLVCTQLQADDLLKLVAYEFGISINIVEKGELLQRLTQQLKAWHRDSRRALLIVDEAQDLSVSAMEELRLLTNIQFNGTPLLQIFLLGQPELKELVLSPPLEQVHQRIVAASHLRPLEIEETKAYILHRLKVVGWCGDPAISDAIYPLVYKYSEGVPRRINLICSRLLLHCAVEQRHRVEVADMREVVQELQGESLAVGSTFSEVDFQVDDGFGQQADPADEAVLDAPEDPLADILAKPLSGSGGSLPGKTPVPGPATDTGVESVAVGEIAVEGGPINRQHLKVVAGVTSVNTRRTETAGQAVAGEAVPLEIGVVRIESALEQSWLQPEVARAAPGVCPGPEKQEEAARMQYAEAATEEQTTLSEEPLAVTARDLPPVRAAGVWEILVIFVVSIALVAWAVSGFELGSFLD